MRKGVINGLTFLVSGSIVVFNFSLLNSCHFTPLHFSSAW